MKRNHGRGDVNHFKDAKTLHMTVTATVLTGTDGPQEKGRCGEDDLAGHGFDEDGPPESN